MHPCPRLVAGQGVPPLGSLAKGGSSEGKEARVEWEAGSMGYSGEESGEVTSERGHTKGWKSTTG